MVGRLGSFWDGLFSGAMLVSGRVYHFMGAYFMNWWMLMIIPASQLYLGDKQRKKRHT